MGLLLPKIFAGSREVRQSSSKPEAHPYIPADAFVVKLISQDFWLCSFNLIMVELSGSGRYSHSKMFTHMGKTTEPQWLPFLPTATASWLLTAG